MLSEVIRSRTEAPEIPVIVVLAEETDDRLEAAFSHGATDYLTRPLRPSVVRQRAHYLLHIKEVQTQLHRQEERYRLISSTLSDYAYSFRIDAEGRAFPEWSTKAFEMIANYRAEEEITDNWAKVVHPDDAHVTQERWKRMIHGERDISEFRVVTARGNVRWMRDHGQTFGRCDLVHRILERGLAMWNIVGFAFGEELAEPPAESPVLRQHEPQP